MRSQALSGSILANGRFPRAYGDFLKARIAEVEAGSLTFVEMVPAYGADLLAACQTVTVTEL